MRKSILFGFVAAVAVAITACGPQRERTILNPAIESSNNYFMQVDRVEMTDSSTVLYCAVDYTPGEWISIDPASRIVAGGVEYPMLSAEGIVPGEQCVMPDSARMAFALTFGPIPAKTKSIDFTEGGSGWSMWGIDVTGNADYFALPDGLPSDLAKKSADGQMPQPVMEVDSATVRVHLLGYRPSMGDKLKYLLRTYAGSLSDQPEATVAPDGTATIDMQLYGTTMFRVRSVGDMSIPTAMTYIAPGETVDLYVDCRRNGDWFLRARKQEYPHADVVWDNGSYAAYNRAVNALADRNLGMDMLGENFADYRMTGEAYTDYVIGQYRSLRDSIAQASLTPLEREVAETALQADLLTAATNSGFLMMYNYSRKHGWMPPEPDSIVVAMTPELMARVEAEVDASDPRLLLPGGFGNLAQIVKDTDAQWLASPLVKDMRVFVPAFGKANDMELTDADMDTLRTLSNPFYAKAVAARAAEMKARMEALDASLLQPVPDVAADKIFDAIVAQHRGKVVLVDLWNTWCGPCRNALRVNEPEKTGDLKSDDIVWIYIADESSPMPEYLSMLPGIKGLHYRLTSDQIGKIRDRFGVDGIPYYILVDREGNATGRPDLRDHALLKQTLLDAVAR